VYGSVFAALPLGLAIAIFPLVGFGPCGPSVPPSVRMIVVAAGTIAFASPFIAIWLFSLSFQRRKIITAIVSLPMLSGSIFICLYWFFVVASAVMSFRFS
jgi:DNA polymerase III psi subunit